MKIDALNAKVILPLTNFTPRAWNRASSISQDFELPTIDQCFRRLPLKDRGLWFEIGKCIGFGMAVQLSIIVRVGR